MSEVRECDRCNKIYALRGDGYSTGTATRTIRVNGRREVETINMDLCPKCSGVDAPAPKSLTGTPSRNSGSEDYDQYDENDGD